MKTIAVVAHYDVDGIADDYLIPLFIKLSAVCDKIIVVTTSGIDLESQKKLKGFGDIEIIERENEGYDFLSYKTGVDSIVDLHLYDRLLVLNDSFYITQKFDLENILLQSNTKDIYGITSTNQFRFHLQSYFLVFNKKAILSRWFFKFWNRIFTFKRKIKIIFEYEMGLTATALQSGLIVGSAVAFNHKENPCHSNVDELFQATGLVKIDVLRNKIAPFDVTLFDHMDVIQRHIKRTAAAYQKRSLKNGQSVHTGSNFFEFVRQGSRKTDIAVIIHIFYPELAGEIHEFLKRIPSDSDVFITVPEESYLPKIIDLFQYTANSLYIAVSENKGRDVYPFVKMMQSHDFSHYAMVLKLHTKKSKYSSLGDTWRKNLYSGLLPSAAKIDQLHSVFRNGDVGIAAPQGDYLSSDNYWGANKDRFFTYARRLGLSDDKIELFFVGGTMFWFNPGALHPLINLIEDSDFEDELNQQDGTFAHVFERLTCMSALSKGLRIIDLNTHHEVNSAMVKCNEVIVLK